MNSLHLALLVLSGCHDCNVCVFVQSNSQPAPKRNCQSCRASSRPTVKSVRRLRRRTADLVSKCVGPEPKSSVKLSIHQAVSRDDVMYHKGVVSEMMHVFIGCNIVTVLDNLVNPVTILSSYLAEELKKMKAAEDEEETLQQVGLLIYVCTQGFA